MEELDVLCAANGYEEKFYFNDKYAKLPKEVKDELKIMCVLFVEDIGGVLSLEFDKDGNLEFSCRVADDDFNFDDIGCELKIRKLRKEKKDLLLAVELYHRMLDKVTKGEDISQDLLNLNNDTE